MLLSHFIFTHFLWGLWGLWWLWKPMLIWNFCEPGSGVTSMSRTLCQPAVDVKHEQERNTIVSSHRDVPAIGYCSITWLILTNMTPTWVFQSPQPQGAWLCLITGLTSVTSLLLFFLVPSQHNQPVAQYGTDCSNTDFFLTPPCPLLKPT